MSAVMIVVILSVAGAALASGTVESGSGEPPWQIAATEPAVYGIDYRRAMTYLARQVAAQDFKPQPVGHAASIISDAKAAVALAEGGMRAPAAALVQSLMRQSYRGPKTLATAIWAVSRTLTIDGGETNASWHWTTTSLARLWRQVAHAPRRSAATLGASHGAIEAALHAVALQGGHWLFRWRWSARAFLVRRQLQTALPASTAAANTKAYLSPAYWQLVPAKTAQRIVAGLWHLGVVEPGLGVRAQPDPQAVGFAADATTTFDYVMVASQCGMGALATAVYDDALPLVSPGGGVYSTLMPVLGQGAGVGVGPVTVGATASYLLATEQLEQTRQFGIGWRATRIRSEISGRPEWVLGRGRFDAPVDVMRGEVPVVVRQASGRAVFWRCMELIVHGFRPLLFWNRPWPGLPASPTHTLTERLKNFSQVVVVGGERERELPRLWRRWLARGGKIFEGSFLPSSARQAHGVKRHVWQSSARHLIAAVDTWYQTGLAGSEVWSEFAMTTPQTLFQPAYLWPLSQWVGAQESLMAAAGESAHRLPALMASMFPYFDETSVPPGCTAARDDPGGREFFDDNGWVLEDDLRAYDLTHDPAWIRRAQILYRFMKSGWDTGGGGEWFNTKRQSRTETATGTFLLAAAQLYQLTRNPVYRKEANRILLWNRRHLAEANGLYGDALLGTRTSPTGIDFPYDTGVVIETDLVAYRSLHQARFLEDAEYLADAVLAHDQDPVTGCLVPLNTVDASEQDAFAAVFTASLADLNAIKPAAQYRAAILDEAREALASVNPQGLAAPDWSQPFPQSAAWLPLLTEASALSLMASALLVRPSNAGSE